MAAYLLGFVLYALLSLPVSLQFDHTLVVHYPLATMIKSLMRLLFSTGFSFENHRDDDFFNEPSTMRPRLTAAAAKEDGSTEHLASLSSPSTYQVVARGLPGAKIHYAAPSA
ncbi:uncharacterized protein PV07_02932 [Cladophialophora immunda]|uniref:Uncharacterized protein n=1 Tax=Cladophialophora immunda TaxID=569365 RepID=A0A0D2CMH2_9EURO|nr:uncharacterized protein PV07_02932 [Cladophialophora immunda]KIW31270.1 hypothetical protein PV07_02932 [Cladophialophora immunda]